ncbi:hypothetical protein [Phreatobacter sp.]|uniref:hypothetical protein n=1 Tax=Phreatobacter sp. TaxID=1966341 RepID=UPI0025DB8AAB|nr:hypothetical protein [Phreatobacter sp.]
MRDLFDDYLSSQLGVATGWLCFLMLLVAGSTPVWGRLAFGFHPTLDQLLLVGCLKPA